MIFEYSQNIARGGVESEDCEKVLGGVGNLSKIVEVYKMNSDLFQLMELDCLLKWQYKRTFDSKELEAFKEGLTALTSYMQACGQEVENIKKKSALQKKKKA